MLNNLGPLFKTYLTAIINWMWKNKKLEDDKVLFKAIKEEKTWIKAKHKISINFTLAKSNVVKGRKEFVEWPKCK